MIEVRGLTKRFGSSEVLDGIDLAVERGERVAVLGMNGAGKTTLIRCLMGITRFSGRVEIGGYSVVGQPRPASACFGYVPQRAPQFEGTLRDTVAFFCAVRGTSVEEVNSRIADLGMSAAEHGEKEVRALSGGMLQKCLLALALGARVPLLLLDEPTANLDARGRREFLGAVRDTDRATTILISTHRLADVEAVADRLLVLHRGKIVFDGDMQELRHKVGAEETLWIDVTPERRAAVRARIEQQWQPAVMRANGSQLGVHMRRELHADVVRELRNAQIAIRGFWTETPTLHDLLDGLLGRDVSGVRGDEPRGVP